MDQTPQVGDNVPDVLAPLAFPGTADWTRLGLRMGPELSGGYQSRVFSAQADDRVVVKLTDERLVDPEQVARRLGTLVELARMNDGAVGPQRHRGKFINRLCGWLVVVYPFVDGAQPDLDRESDVARMGRTLAGLHRSMAEIPTSGLPAVAALRVTAPATTELHPDRSQLIHGDFAAANLCLAGGRLGAFGRRARPHWGRCPRRRPAAGTVAVDEVPPPGGRPCRSVIVVLLARSSEPTWSAGTTSRRS